MLVFDAPISNCLSQRFMTAIATFEQSQTFRLQEEWWSGRQTIANLYVPILKYSELDSSGSVKKLTKRVSLKRKYEELKLHILFNK